VEYEIEVTSTLNIHVKKCLWYIMICILFQLVENFSITFLVFKIQSSIFSTQV
jgi:hypothetical protein